MLGDEGGGGGAGGVGGGGGAGAMPKCFCFNVWSNAQVFWF